MGCGKSFLGQQLAKKLAVDFIDLDTYFVEKEGISINECFEKWGEATFRTKESQLLKNIDITKRQVVSTGGGTPCFFDNMDWMNRNGVTFFLNASIDLLAQRLEKEKVNRPLIKNLTTSQLYDFIAQKNTDRLPYYTQAKNCISFNQNDEYLVLEKLLEIIY